MIQNYWKMVFRGIRKSKIFSSINIAGFALGLAASFLMLMHVKYEYDFDRCYPNSKDIYRVTSWSSKTNDWYSTSALYLAGQLSEIPEIASTTRVVAGSVLVKKDVSFFREERLGYVDFSFFTLFSISFLSGSAAESLNEPLSVVLTQSMAMKYFGDEDALGKTLVIRKQNETLYPLTVTGIIPDFPHQSHMHLDMIVPIGGLYWNYENIDRRRVVPSFESWGTLQTMTYVLLRKGTSPTVVESRINDTIQSHLNSSYPYKLILQPLRKIHLYSYDIENEFESQQDIRRIMIFLLTSFILLIVAVLNYIILTTSRTVEKAREIGIRKVLGADRRQVLLQILGESVLIALIAFPLALTLVEFVRPYFNGIMHTRIPSWIQASGILVPWFLIVVFVAGLLSGLTMAIRFMKVQPMGVVQNTWAGGTGRSRFRQALTLIHLLVFITLFVGAMTIERQMKYVHSNETLGFVKENVVSVKVNVPNFYLLYPGFRQCLLEYPDIEYVASSFSSPLANSATLIGFQQTTRNGKKYSESQMGHMNEDEMIESGFQVMEMNTVDQGYIEALGIQMIEGQSFQDADIRDNSHVLVNQTFIKDRRILNPERQTIKLWDEHVIILGVFKDFHSRSLYNKVLPLVLRVNTRYISQVIVRYKQGSENRILEILQDEWKSLVPDSPLEYGFLENELNATYGPETQFGRLIGIFAGLAILIAGLGLFGLSLHVAEHRTREMVIRKVFGATSGSVVHIMLYQFLKLLAIALVAAFPLSWFLMRNWLQNFAYRTRMTVGLFLLSAGAALIVVVATVIFQIVRTARANPVEVLKYE